MNFFQHQQRARRNTTALTIMFAAAVAAIVIAVYVVAIVVVTELRQKQKRTHRFADVDRPATSFVWWDAEVFAYSAAVTLLVIGFGTAMKTAQLRSGGAAVAKMLGGRLVPPGSKSPGEKRLLNVVEEMAIASGMPVPSVYVLDAETGINAFAAGYSTADAVVAVTRGCLTHLTRDELQGVLAHEFSHILNGDMRLNIRLTGLIFGILIIGMTGIELVRSLGRGRVSSGRGKGAGGVILVGLALAVIGYVGVFFGRLIRAAVSRQREFLADASAVDFTRNPAGIAGALRKIGGLSSGSRVGGAKAEEVSHFFFADALPDAFPLLGFLYGSHPPLAERIRRIDPAFDGTFPQIAAHPAAGSPLELDTHPRRTASLSPLAAAVALAPSEVVAAVGAPTSDHVQAGSALLESIPPLLQDAVREPFGATATVFALLLDSEPANHDAQMACIRTACDHDLVAEVERLGPATAALDRRIRLVLLDLALPALRQLEHEQLQQALNVVEALAAVDQRMTVFEFTLQHVLRRRLAANLGNARAAPPQFFSFPAVRSDIAVLLSVLARAGHAGKEQAEHAYAAAVQRLPPREHAAVPMRGAGECSLKRLDAALDRLGAAAPRLKEYVVDAAAHCVLADRQVTVQEAELLRLVCDALDCPLPPFLPSADARP